MKKMLSSLLVLLLVSGCTSAKPDTTPSSGANVGCDVTSVCAEGEKADMSAYDSFMDTDHVYRTITMKDANELLQSDKTFVLYYGFSTCPWCVELLPVLNDVAKEAGYPVHYVNVRPEGTDSSFDIRVDENEDYVKLKELVDEYLPLNDEGVKRLPVPFVFFVKEGKVMSTHIGTLDSHDAKERKMTEDEITQLTKELQDEFSALKK